MPCLKIDGGIEMSNVNIKSAVENIRANTTGYTPSVEMIVNATQSLTKLTGPTEK